MAKPKLNPGKYPVPQYALDHTIGKRKKNNQGRKSGNLPEWWPTPELTQEIMQRVVDGQSLKQITNDPNMPTNQRILVWVCQGREAKEKPDLLKSTHPDIVKFSGAWVRAGVLRMEGDVGEMQDMERRLIEIPQVITSEQKDAAGRHYQVPNPKALNPQAARIVFENRRWRLSRLDPDRFGDKSKVEHSGTVTVEKPVDHAPEWMQEKIKDQAAKVAQAEPPPAAPAKDDDEATVH